jgi:hypothetical protein
VLSAYADRCMQVYGPGMELTGARPETALDREDARVLADIAARFPGWEVRRMLGGYVAVPQGTPVLRATSLDSLRDKLAEALGAD